MFFSLVLVFMATVSHIVKKIVKENPLLEEFLSRKLINYASLAEELHPKIELELNKTVKHTAILMALRRLSEELENKNKKTIKKVFLEDDIIIKENLIELIIEKEKILKNKESERNYKKLLEKLDSKIQIVNSTYEIILILNKKLYEKTKKILEEYNFKIKKEHENLSSITIRISEEATNTIGFFYIITKELAFNNINLYEILSTYTELTLLLKEKDIIKAFEVLKKLKQTHF